MNATWKSVLDSYPEKERILRQILRSRRKFYPIALNGRVQIIRRALVRDYLREVLA